MSTWDDETEAVGRREPARRRLIRPIDASGRRDHPAERVIHVHDHGGLINTLGPYGCCTRNASTVQVLPEDYTHEVWAKQPPLLGGAWQFEYGGRVDDCVRYLDQALRHGSRIWEFSIRPMDFLYFTEE